MIGPTPLLDFFKRGEVPRDAKLLAAQGVLAPRASEQLAILVLLLEDREAEIRTVAEATLNRIPVDALQAYLARPDVPLGLREFFGDRGVFPGEVPALEADEPLIDASGESEAAEEHDRESAVQKLAAMAFTDRLKAAIKGTREIRAILIRDPNKMIAAAVLSSPKMSESEVESFVRMTSVSEDVLRIIASNRVWTKNYGVVAGLSRNPKTPLGMSLNLLGRLNARDLASLSVDRNVPETLRIAARKKVVASVSGH